MGKNGILVHVHHLGTKGWEELLWGDPTTDRFGSLATVALLLLTESADNPIGPIVIGCGPSEREGLSEAAYTIQTMVQYVDRLHEFPRLAPLLKALSPQQFDAIRTRIAGIIPTPVLRNTHAEVRTGSALLAEHGATTIYEVCAASHAPRCIQTVAQARYDGDIPHDQLWLTVATDMCFDGAVPDDTIILEPSHRGDDNPHSLPHTLKPVIRMPADRKEELASLIQTWLQKGAA